MSSSSPGQLAQIACVWEVLARKPGNVHRGCDFDDSHLVDFLLSAASIAGPLDRAGTLGVGRAVYEAVESTRRIVATNTNLGMILLLAPLAAAFGTPLQERVQHVLNNTTIDDARWVYRAIRLAQPGGLGNVAEQDVASEPTVTLVEAMRLAADRDLVARQYANGFAEVFGIVAPALHASLEAGWPLETAIIQAHLQLLAQEADTLIARKRGLAEAAEASRKASQIVEAGWPDAGRALFHEFDAWLRAEGHARNPGATADLVAAGLFVALADGTIRLPRPAGRFDWQID